VANAARGPVSAIAGAGEAINPFVQALSPGIVLLFQQLLTQGIRG
jgi:hypothetical protein